MTSLQLKHKASRDKSRKSGRIKTQEATENFILKIRSSCEEEVPSKHLLFLSFQIVQKKAIRDRRHMIFLLKVEIGQAHWWNMSGKDRGITQLQLNSLRIASQIALVCLQWRKRWSTDSSSAKQRGQALTMGIFRRRRLSIVRILFWRASQTKARTLGGAFNFLKEGQPRWVVGCSTWRVE